MPVIILMRNSTLALCAYIFQNVPYSSRLTRKFPLLLPLDRGEKITGNQPTANNEDEYQIFVPFHTRGVMHDIRSS